MGNHRVELKVLNPTDKAETNPRELIIYSHQPTSVAFK